MDKALKDLLVNSGRALYGERWQTDLARDLGLSDGRRIRQWLSGERPIPEDIEKDLATLLKKRQRKIEKALKEMTVPASPVMATR
jgi:hypothetical protein